ncbi:hypothetical protein GPALN_006027 [Globodera pallida]|nr:hypothetical protein GPALN_006027 [Globodera pallida]
MTIFGFLAFCFVLNGTVFADFKCFNALENAAFDGSEQNVLVKLFKESELSNGTGEDEELKQFVCDLSEHEIVIGAALDDQAKGLSPPIKPFLKEEFEFLKKLKLIDKSVAELLHKLQKSISTLKNSISEGVLEENATFKDLKSDFYETAIFLANRWQIPINEIVSMGNDKIDAKSLLKELAKIWAKNKDQNGQKSNEKRNNGESEKRMLRLMMDLSSDGIDGLANLKSVKKRQRRRRKRGNAAIPILAVFLCVLLVLAFWFCNSNRQKKQRDLEAGIFERDEVVELEPLPRERPAEKNRRKPKWNGKALRPAKKSRKPKWNGKALKPAKKSRKPKWNGKALRPAEKTRRKPKWNGKALKPAKKSRKPKWNGKALRPAEKTRRKPKWNGKALKPAKKSRKPKWNGKALRPAEKNRRKPKWNGKALRPAEKNPRRKKSSQAKMEWQDSESWQPLNQLSHSSSKGDPSRGKSPAHPDVSNGSVHSSSDTEEITKNHDYARKRDQESKKRSHPESIEKGTEKAGVQLEIQNITSDQLSKINVVSGDITKQKVSVIVTDANGQLRHGGGINDAIHRACEPDMSMLQLVLNTLIMSKGSAYPPGSVVVTEAFGNLLTSVQFIAHAVGPNVQGRNPSAEDTSALKLCYTESLDALIAKNGQTIAFPNISTETNGFPKDLAAVAALEAILNWLNTGANEQQVQQITLAKRQIVPPRPSTPKTSAISEPSTSQSPPPAPLPLAVIDKPTPIVEQAIRQSVSCVNVKGDGDCFYRAICYGLFRVDSKKNSDALRKSSGRILRAILENSNFFPRKRYRSHADFTHALSQLLLPSPSDLWHDQTLEAYSQFIEKPARDGIGIWAQLDDAHTIAILLQRPVVILRPIAENDILRQERPKWNNKSITQRIDVRFPDGEYMGMTRNIPHVQLNSFTVQERTPEDVLVERTVVNPIVIWYDGIEHYQSIIFDPKSSNASAGSEYVFAQNFDIPEDFLRGNEALQQQHPPEQQPQGMYTEKMLVDAFDSLLTETACCSPTVSSEPPKKTLT